MPGWLQAFVTANPVIAAAADQWPRSRTRLPTRRRLAIEFPIRLACGSPGSVIWLGQRRDLAGRGGRAAEGTASPPRGGRWCCRRAQLRARAARGSRAGRRPAEVVGEGAAGVGDDPHVQHLRGVMVRPGRRVCSPPTRRRTRRRSPCCARTPRGGSASGSAFWHFSPPGRCAGPPEYSRSRGGERDLRRLVSSGPIHGFAGNRQPEVDRGDKGPHDRRRVGVLG